MLRKILLTTMSIAATTGAALADGAITTILDGEPGKISAAGITVYGTIDVGYVYQSKGTPDVPASFYQGAPYNIIAASRSSYSNWQNNALGVSNIGVKGEQSLEALSGMDGLRGWSLGFDLQVNFDPLDGALADICKTLTINNGRTALTQTANGDGQRCGQLFSGNAYGYIKNSTLGTLGFGRQTSLLADTIGASDVNAGSTAFSLFGYSGTYGGGGGITEEGRWNNSLKYTNTIAGLVRVGAMYRFEGAGQGGDAWGFRAGVDLPFVKGLSIDGAYQKQNTGIASASLSSANCTTFFGAGNLAGCQSSNYLAGTLSDNESWALTAKYKIEKATFAGGYERIEFSNPSDPTLDNHNTIGGYVLATLNTTKYTTSRDLDVYWAGASYQVMPKLTGNIAWYHVDAHSYTASGKTCPATAKAALGIATASNCSGSFNEYSVAFTYALAKRLDLYAGASWTDVSGGLASGFLASSEYNLVTGVRFKF